LVWLAVLATLGIRSSVAALIAGLSFTIFPTIATKYRPSSFAEVSVILFGLGAILLAKFPEGTVAMQARSFRSMTTRIRGGGHAPDAAEPAPEPALAGKSSGSST
jgi:branched-chain amino acid transport system permease protein